jgi:hypothetical protein
MPKTKISEYSATNSANTDIEGINIDEGCPPSSINNAIREVMVHLKEFQTGASGDAFTFAGGTLMSGTNTISGAAVISGNINSSGTTNTFSGGNILSGTNTFSGTNIFSSDVTLNAQSDLRFADSDSSNWVAFQSPATVASNVTWTLPAADGTSNQVLATNGSGTLSWATAGGGASISAGDSKVEVTDTGSNGTIVFNTDNAERMRVTSAGNVGVNTTSPAFPVDINGGSTTGFTPGLRIKFTNSDNAGCIQLGNNPTGSGTVCGLRIAGDTGGGTTYDTYRNTGGAPNHAFLVNSTERMRIDSSGNIFAGGNYTVSYPGESNTTTGIFLEGSGKLGASRDNTNPFYVNRNTSDGTLISLRTGGTEQGTISVSGGTVSYNAFAGSHWSQLSDGSKPDILRGTVMESINELIEWPNEPITERLPKCKISDTVGSKKVYGVFMDWDNDWTATNDMYVTAVGAFVCRINKDVLVQEGDLLESNGDGTARVQADDVIRSSTIGKVTCTIKSHEYDDGSYCVPTVLYCG